MSLSPCSVGDGGLDQIHEVSWFPEGSKEGVIIFSSAHPEQKSKVTSADLYRKDLLGNEMYFNDRLAAAVISSHLKKADLKGAQAVITDSLDVLAKMRDGIEGSTGESIPAINLNRDNWALIQAYRLGLSLEEPGFSDAYKDMEATVNGTSRTSARDSEIYQKMLPIYQWLNDTLENKSKAELDISSLEKGVVGHDPVIIAKFLESDQIDPKFARKSFGTGEFWLGIKLYLSGDKQSALKHLDKYLQSSQSNLDAFEIAATANLKSKISSHEPIEDHSLK